MNKPKKNKKLNCWELKKCGREHGGVRSKASGVCPAAKARKLDGLHDGTNAGRACWIISGTYCDGEQQGTFAQKFENCCSCEFYAMVRKEEFPNFIPSAILTARLD